MRDELKCALKENNVAFELNPCMFYKKMPESFVDDYLGWVSDMQRSGVTLSFGSDCHKAHITETEYGEIDKLLSHYGIDSDKFFCL